MSIRFYPITYHEYDERGSTHIIIFAYQEDGSRVALRMRYHHTFYVSVGDYTANEVNDMLRTTNGAGVDGEIVTMNSTIDLHRKIDVVKISCSDLKTKYKAMEVFSNRKMSTHDKHAVLTPLLKMMVEKDVRRYMWMDVDVAHPATKITKLEHEYIARYNTLRPVDVPIPLPKFSILSFDIETDSQNPKKMSNSAEPGSAIRMACLTLVHGDRYEEHSIVYGPDISHMVMEDAEKGKAHIPSLVSRIHTVPDELSLIRTLLHLFNELDPDVIAGHNHMGFDIPYLVDRMILLAMTKRRSKEDTLRIPNISRLIDYTCTTKKSSFDSAAASITAVTIDAPGRIWVDTMILSIREFMGRMPDNKLSTLASSLLGMTKDDVPVQDMFNVYRLCESNTERVKEVYESLLSKHNIDAPPEKPRLYNVDALNGLISTINIINQRGKKMKVYMTKDTAKISIEDEYDRLRKMTIDAIGQWNIKKMEDPTAKEMIDVCWWILVKYCIQDTRIPYQLIDTQGIIPILCEQASIYNVDIHDLQRAGKVKLVNSSQYKYRQEKGVMMDFGNEGGPTGAYPYEGGLVAKVIPGLKVKPDSIGIIFDFTSLYPMVIIAYNLDHDTWVPPNMREVGDHYIFDRYKEELEARRDEPLIKAILDAPYEERGKMMCNIFEVDNPSTECKHVHWFLKKEIKEGVFPAMLWEQYNARKSARRRMGEARKDGNHSMVITYDAQQLAIKVAMNSAYGALGTKYNTMANFPIAETICYIGRESILACNKYVEDRGIGSIIYNDTDSAIVLVDGIKERFNGDVAVLEDYANKLASEISTQYTSPMALEYEGLVMSILVKAPKMYAFIQCNGRSLDMEDYTTSTVNSMGLLTIKGMAPVRRDKSLYNKMMMSNILCDILLYEDARILIAKLERAITNIWNLQNRDMTPNLARMMSYRMGVTAKALNGGSNAMAKWVVGYMKKYGTTVPPGEKFELMVTVGENASAHTRSADKLVTYDWFIEEGRTLDVIHYILAMAGQGNVVELMHIAYPDIVQMDCIQKYYLPTLKAKGCL